MSPYNYRRSSFLWALILIAIGVLFLLHNLDPAIHPWHLLAKYWPVLIILWGVSKLFDYIAARLHRETSPPVRFSGAEGVLLILFLVLGTLFSHVVLSPRSAWKDEWEIHLGPGAWENPFLNSYTFTRNISQAVLPGAELSLANERGDIAIQGTNVEEVNATVKATIRAASEADAENINKELQIQILHQNGQYVLHPNLDALPRRGSSVRLDWEVRAPAASSADVSTRHGDILISGLEGPENLSVRSGDVHVAEAGGNVKIQETGGSADVRGAKSDVEVNGRGNDLQIADVSGKVTVNGTFSGSVRFQNLQQGVLLRAQRTEMEAGKQLGKLEMGMGSIKIKGIGGPLQINTRQKDIRVSAFKKGVSISDKNGNIHLLTSVEPRGPIEVNLQDGDILLALPAHSSFVMEAISAHGTVDSDFSAPGLTISQQGERPSIRGTFGQGGPMIRLSTSYGTIHLMRQAPARSKPVKGLTGKGTVATVFSLH
ncbi:MAG: DUF4097 family beta strand repeat-containing protein [Terriglobia bacterium]